MSSVAQWVVSPVNLFTHPCLFCEAMHIQTPLRSVVSTPRVFQHQWWQVLQNPLLPVLYM